jgi:hypothetical protein
MLVFMKEYLRESLTSLKNNFVENHRDDRKIRGKSLCIIEPQGLRVGGRSIRG